jgi:hypothetical protein
MAVAPRTGAGDRVGREHLGGAPTLAIDSDSPDHLAAHRVRILFCHAVGRLAMGDDMSRSNAAHNGVTQLSQRVAVLVPDYSGYQETAARRDDDGRLRLEVCERLDLAANRLEDFLLELSEEGWNPGVEALDRLIRELEALRNQMTSPGAEESAFLRTDRLAAAPLKSLIEADLGLMVELDTLIEHLEELGLPDFRTGALRATLRTVTTHIDAVVLAQDRRRDMARSLGDGSDA